MRGDETSNHYPEPGDTERHNQDAWYSEQDEQSPYDNSITILSSIQHFYVEFQ
jgi:hypothetical protein